MIRQQAQKTSLLGLLTCFVVGAIVSTASVARAEGSRTLYPSDPLLGGSFRANLEWRPAEQYGSLIPRSSLMKVYAKKDEYILVGSSAIGTGTGEIGIFYPSSADSQQLGTNTFSSAIPNYKCTAQRSQVGAPAAMGRITSRTEELAGPRSPVATTGAGYIPCYLKAPTDGIYSVVFQGPTTAQGAPTGDIDIGTTVTNPNNFSTSQGNSVAAWDITVRSSDTSTIDLNGRVFSYNMAMFVGGSNGRPINFLLHPVTNDGYRYELNLRNVDPNGFILYGNQVGFFDQDGKTPLYRDAVGPGPLLTTVDGGVKFAVPQFPIFLNPVDAGAVLGNLYTYDTSGAASLTGIPLIPTKPSVSNLTFTGNQAGNTSVVGSSNFGKFTFDLTGITSPVNYEILIFRDGTKCDPTQVPYDPIAANCDVADPNNRSLRGVTDFSASQTVAWDGKDNSGNNFPIGANYKAIIKIHPGEYHFPLIDSENAKSVTGNVRGAGITIKKLNGADAGNTTAYYDDRGYRTINVYNPATGALITPGVNVGTPGTVLSGNSPPVIPFSNMLSGFDSASNQRAYGNGASSGFGDGKGLDLWTYLVVDAVTTQLNILAPPPKVTLAKRITKVNTTAIATLVDQIGGTGDTNDNNPLWPNLTGTATQIDSSTGASVGSTANFSQLLKGATVLLNPQPKPKEELEYTIYYLSNGGQTAKNMTLCDFVPANTTYVPGSLQVVKGSAAAVNVSDIPGDTDGGFYTVGTAQAAMHAACKTVDSTDTTRGAVYVNIGDVAQAATSATAVPSTGYIHFRVTVEVK